MLPAHRYPKETGRLQRGLPTGKNIFNKAGVDKEIPHYFRQIFTKLWALGKFRYLRCLRFRRILLFHMSFISLASTEVPECHVNKTVDIGQDTAVLLQGR
jgi:hypothetical protein